MYLLIRLWLHNQALLFLLYHYTLDYYTQQGIHEGTIEQVQRLFAERLYTADDKVLLDDKGFIRIDDLEMREDVQAEVAALWEKVSTNNLAEISDIEGYRNEFFNLFGFNFDGIDYNADVNELVTVRQ